MINNNFKYLIWFLICILLQIFLFNQIHIIPYLNVFVYVLFILILPFEISVVALMLLSFIIGLIIDAFSNTIGIHAAASVFLAFLRPKILRLYSPRDGYEKNTIPSISDYGFIWFFKYSLTLILFHHFTLFLLDAFGFYLFHLTLLRTVLSSIASITIIILIQFLTIRRK